MNNNCRINGCNNQILSKKHSLCSKHYQRLKNNGDPEKLLIAPKGNGSLCKDGYLRITVNGRRIKEHNWKAENALGRKLKNNEVVHHVDGNKINNKNSNLVICPNAAYHHLLHLRTRAIENGHPAHYRKCPFCKKYDDPLIMVRCSSDGLSHHKCKYDYHFNYIRNRKNEQAL